jgi:predicted DNA-binding protein
MKRTTIDLPDDVTLQLKLHAVQTGKTLKEVITEAIKTYLERSEKK